MTLADLVGMFPARIGGRQARAATRRGAIHIVNPTWMPRKTFVSPAEWKYMRRKHDTPIENQSG